MTLATTTSIGESRPRAVNLGQVALDVAILAIATAICGLMFFQGGFEALVGSAIGAALAKRNGAPLSSGAFAGLFAGAMFAGFFHGALIGLIDALS
jgi:hypothetical protein